MLTKTIEIISNDGSRVELNYGYEFEQLAIQKFSDIDSNNKRSDEDCVREMVLEQIRKGNSF